VSTDSIQKTLDIIDSLIEFWQQRHAEKVSNISQFIKDLEQIKASLIS
tara:strand:+ start:536 stop:679 length:144 start_codon:yes stop_codon:yes gene_type:complete